MTVAEQISPKQARANARERILYHIKWYIEDLGPASQLIVAREVMLDLRSSIECIEREQKKKAKR